MTEEEVEEELAIIRYLSPTNCLMHTVSLHWLTILLDHENLFEFEVV